MLSASGVQQGDPLGPLLFAAAIQPLTVELRGGLDLGLFFLDDGVLAGDIPAVGAALAHTQRRAAELGLQLNLRKCEVVAVGNVSAADLVGHLPDALLRTPESSSKVLQHFELLGAPIGDSASSQVHSKARVDQTKALLDAIGELEDPQIGLRLLRSCTGHCRIVHSMRSAPPEPQLPAFQEFDRQVRACFSSLTGLHLTDGQWTQASLGFAQGGLGLRAAEADAAAAYLASVGGTADLCSIVDSGLLC